MESFLAYGIISVGCGLVVGGVTVWVVLSDRLNNAREAGRGEGQVERAALQERLTRADSDLMDLRTQVIEFRTVTETTRKELEIARTAIASLTAKTEQIPPLSAELVQLRQESKDRASDLAKSQAELAKMGKDRDHFKDQMGKEKGSGVIFNPT